MIKKIISGISLALVAVLAPLCFVGCKKSYNPTAIVGDYVVKSVSAVFDDKNVNFEEADADKAAANGEASYTELSPYSQQVAQYLNMAAENQIGFTLAKSGKIEVTIPKSVEVNGKSQEIPKDFRDQIEEITKDLTWFARKNVVYLSGNFGMENPSGGSGDVSMDSFSFGQILGGKLNFDKKAKTLTLVVTATWDDGTNNHKEVVTVVLGRE